ncbi:MAG: ABC transporter [Epulopiscium sp. Nele67-Bin004]|nr:MAG: ABC transporter [Epulopiscium sp. Nele67-Bin004]
MRPDEQKPDKKGGPPPKGGGFGGPGRGPGGPVEKPKNFKASIKKLAHFSKQYKSLVFTALFLSVISATFTLIGPSKLTELTDIIGAGMMNSIDTDAVREIATFLIAIYVGGLACGYLQTFIMATVSQQICKKLRSSMIQKINNLPLSYFDKRTYGETLSRITNDIDTIGVSLNQSLSSLLSGIIIFFGALILMFYTNWVMATTALLSTLLGFGLMGLIINLSQKFFAQQQAHLGKINGHIEEVYSGHNIVVAFNAQQTVSEYFYKSNEALYKSAWKAQYISGVMMPIMGFVSNFSYVCVCIVGAILTMQGHISFGVVVAFMVYIRIFTQPLQTLAQAATTLQSAAAASERVFDILEEKELEHETSSNIEATKGNVDFIDVSFGYNPDKMIIKNFSAKVVAGQKVAIVGPTGAGKTTLVNLLMKFYDLNSGEILIDGTPISKMTRENIHDQFAMVLQDTWMFEGTIIENIAYNQDYVTKENIVEACKAVGIHHTIMTMPKGYETMMSNATLSVGEKQLITIARAMVKRSNLLILDEATSSVDTRTELLIQQAMDTLSQGKTSFIIAHRLSTIKNADLILVMKDGNIIESGNHETLLEMDGFYANLYNSQFQTS